MKSTAAVIVQQQCLIIYQNARPCATHSSFDGELFALSDAVDFIALSLVGCIVIIADNEAAIKAATNLCIPDLQLALVFAKGLIHGSGWHLPTCLKSAGFLVTRGWR